MLSFLICSTEIVLNQFIKEFYMFKKDKNWIIDLEKNKIVGLDLKKSLKNQFADHINISIKIIILFYGIH